MILVVTGSRGWNDKALLESELKAAIEELGVTQILVGDACGVDLMVREYCAANKFPCKVFVPDWVKFGRRAGPLRNTMMIVEMEAANGRCIAFWDGRSKGTHDTIKKARLLDKLYKIVLPKPELVMV